MSRQKSVIQKMGEAQAWRAAAKIVRNKEQDFICHAIKQLAGDWYRHDVDHIGPVLRAKMVRVIDAYRREQGWLEGDSAFWPKLKYGPEARRKRVTFCWQQARLCEPKWQRAPSGKRRAKSGVSR